MSLYLLEDSENPIKVYGRNPCEIQETVRHYYDRWKKIHKSRKVLPIWRNIPDEDDLKKVNKGRLVFSVSTWVYKDYKGLTERLEFGPDFEVRTDIKSIESLYSLRDMFPALKRGPLYKIQSSRFRGITFIPEDIKSEIERYDFTELLFRADELKRAIEEQCHS